ncbi:DUF3592 domain-containing protein [Petroclostridium sp. X23]|jgi:hypothetical protein|uniref:DUF3592 domain-containing protein n=1 Tax=Petroclostridium sp. X23 TaxID=3045146 RepID=UPI0024AE480E|nr:DUF3592 domain-containing protein [Petroclostridium sp. X23]WHH57753.1 DUF3592 domain-containing protein [Petroclostridium sp. X23]
MMNDLLIFSAIGLITMVLGIVLLKNEKRLFKDPVTTDATVVIYYDYRNLSGMHPTTMYTMAVEYYLPDGQLIHAREQQGSTNKKYAVGTKIDIVYSRDKPDLFIVKGDKSRMCIFYGMIVTGALMMVVGIITVLNGG